MMEEIHFLVDEISEKLDKDIKGVLQQIKDPKAKERIALINKFTRALVKASLPQQGTLHKPFKTPPINMEQYKLPPYQPAQRLHKIYPHYRQPYYQAIVSTPPPMQQRHIQPEIIEHPAIPKVEDIPHIEKLEPLPQPLQPVPAREELTPPTKETLLNTTIKDITQHLPEVHQQPEPAHTEPEKITLIVESVSKKTVVTAEIKDDIYQVVEPYLSAEDKTLLTEVRKEMEGSESILKDREKTQKLIRKKAKKLKMVLNEEDRDASMKIRYYLVRNLLNFGQVEPLLHDEKIDKIICEGIQKPVIIIRSSKQLKTNIIFTHQELLNSFLFHVAKKTYQPLSLEEPILEATYKSFRIQGTLGTDIVPGRFIISRE